MTDAQAQQQDTLRAIVVHGQEGVTPEALARDWVHRLALADGVRVAVLTPQAPARPRRFVAHLGGVTSVRRYAAMRLVDAVEDLLHRADRPLDAWELLQAGRQVGAWPSEVVVATVKQAARLLTQEGRAQVGLVRDTWSVVRVDERVA